LRHGLTGPKSHGLVAMLQREGEYLAALVGLASPILFAFFAAATARGLTRRASAGARVLAVVAVATVAFFAYSALQRRAEANWPAPAYLPPDKTPNPPFVQFPMK